MLSTKLAGAAVAATKNCYLLTLRMSLMTAMMFPALLMLKLPREESPLVSSKLYTGGRDQETLTDGEKEEDECTVRALVGGSERDSEERQSGVVVIVAR
jgi:hypothetical protein